MRRLAALLLLAAAACGGDEPSGPGERPVEFRAITEAQNAAYCVKGPEFAVASGAAEWRAIFERQTACQPGSSAEVPPLDLDREVGVAAWWKVAGCLGHSVRTTSVTRTRSNAILVTAESKAPSGACAAALGGLESFLAVQRSAAEGATVMRFVLDGVIVGSAPISV